MMCRSSGYPNSLTVAASVVSFSAPVWRIQSDPVPLDRLLAQKFVQCHIEPLDRQVAIHVERDELLKKR
jgi:hypothetical protein